MKHATDKALDQLEPLLVEIRKLGHLNEKTRGIFYLKSTAFLHFHEDPTGLFADLKKDDGFERCSVNSLAEQKSFVLKVKDAVAAFSAHKK